MRTYCVYVYIHTYLYTYIYINPAGQILWLSLDDMEQFSNVVIFGACLCNDMCVLVCVCKYACCLVETR